MRSPHYKCLRKNLQTLISTSVMNKVCTWNLQISQLSAIRLLSRSYWFPKLAEASWPIRTYGEQNFKNSCYYDHPHPVLIPKLCSVYGINSTHCTYWRKPLSVFLFQSMRRELFLCTMVYHCSLEDWVATPYFPCGRNLPPPQRRHLRSRCAGGWCPPQAVLCTGSMALWLE